MLFSVAISPECNIHSPSTARGYWYPAFPPWRIAPTVTATSRYYCAPPPSPPEIELVEAFMRASRSADVAALALAFQGPPAPPLPVSEFKVSNCFF